MSADANAVLNIISQFLEHVEKTPAELTAETPLYADGLGLDSVEAAELSATLEDEFGSDPFSAGELPETIAEILAFYQAPASA